MINTKTLLHFSVLALIGFMMLSTMSFGATVMVGMEDLAGPYPPASDRDFNDIQIDVSGITLHYLDPFSFVPFPEYTAGEVPFPDGYFIDYGTVSGSEGVGTVTINSRQAAYFDIAMIQIGLDGEWIDVTPAGLTFIASAGTRIGFAVRTPYETFYGDRALNSDGMYHVVGTGEPGGEVPEPESGQLMVGGVGLLALSWIIAWRKRKLGVDTPDGKV